MHYGWLFFISFAAIAACLLIVWGRHLKRQQERTIKNVAVIAHTSAIKRLPAYRRAKRNYCIMLCLALVCFLVTFFSLTAVAARPIERQERNTENEKRDLILCLDVSGSMTNYQKQLLETFSKIVDGMHGQRIGITIFDGKPASIIPLSDDYDAVMEQIDDLAKNITSNFSYTNIVFGESNSAIGDGVMGCINNLGSYENSKRAQSVLIATDNEYGDQTVDINQPARYANRYGITFYGIYNGYSSSNKNYLEFENAVTITGGTLYMARENQETDDISEGIIGKIIKQETEKSTGAPEILYLDSPAAGIIVAAISFAIFLGLIWRLHL